MVLQSHLFVRSNWFTVHTIILPVYSGLYEEFSETLKPWPTRNRYFSWIGKSWTPTSLLCLHLRFHLRSISSQFLKQTSHLRPKAEKNNRCQLSCHLNFRPSISTCPPQNQNTKNSSFLHETHSLHNCEFLCYAVIPILASAAKVDALSTPEMLTRSSATFVFRFWNYRRLPVSLKSTRCYAHPNINLRLFSNHIQSPKQWSDIVDPIIYKNATNVTFNPALPFNILKLLGLLVYYCSSGNFIINDKSVLYPIVDSVIFRIQTLSTLIMLCSKLQLFGTMIFLPRKAPL